MIVQSTQLIGFSGQYRCMPWRTVSADLGLGGYVSWRSCQALSSLTPLHEFVNFLGA